MNNNKKYLVVKYLESYQTVSTKLLLSLRNKIPFGLSFLNVLIALGMMVSPVNDVRVFGQFLLVLNVLFLILLICYYWICKKIFVNISEEC